MTDLNTNFQETVNNTLQECLNNSLRTSSQKTSILMWTANLPNSFILKKDGKRYLGLMRKDRKGGDYWKFKEISGKKSENKKEDANNSNSPE